MIGHVRPATASTESVGHQSPNIPEVGHQRPNIQVVNPYLPVTPPCPSTEAPLDTVAAPAPLQDAEEDKPARQHHRVLAALSLSLMAGLPMAGPVTMPPACISLAGRCMAVDPLPAHMVGTTVDKDMAQRLGITNDELFSRLKSMGFNTVRIGAYWDEIQPKGPNDANFAALDAQLDAAHRAGLDVILTVGAKAPTWPEYHTPAWANPSPFLGDVGDDPVFEKRVLAFDARVVQHERDRSNIVMFQVENEPLDPAGPAKMRIDNTMLEAEARTIRQEDTRRRPLMVNVWSEEDPVEFGNPFGTVEEAARVGDVVGIDVYPYVGDTHPDPLRSQRTEVFPEFAYRYVKAVGKRPMVTELQADDWGSYHVSADDIRANFEEATSQGYGDVLFWRQSTVEDRLRRGDTSLLKVETDLSHQLTNSGH